MTSSRVLATRIAALVATLFAACFSAPPPPARADDAPPAALVADFRRDPLRFFFDMRATEAIACGQVVLRDDATAPDEQRRVLTALATIYLATGREEQARAAVREILARDPAADLDRPEALPPPVVRLFYGIRDSQLLASGTAAKPDIRTLAIGDIENNSIVKGKYDLDHFARGLTQILTTDLKDVTPLRLVDRQRLAVLRDEIRMSESAQIMDAKFRVPLGQLSGAQSFLFGSLMQVDAQKIRLDLRWVNTATGEILLAEGVETKLRSADDLFKLERKIVLEMFVPQIQEMLGESAETKQIPKTAKPYFQAKKKSLPKDGAYVDFLLKTGEAVLAEERGDLTTAEAAWSEVRKLSPTDPIAEGRALALEAQRRLGA